MKFLKQHPFPVLANFERVVAVSFAFPESILSPLVGRGLELDTYSGYGFVTVALVWTRNLRPAGFPAFLGQDFFLAGYRVFVRFRDTSGRTLRGLKILRSETDKHRMVWLGNLMTGYRYRYVHLRIDAGLETRVETSLADGTRTLDLIFETSGDSFDLPVGSPFADWRSARRFAGPMPFTFSPEADGSFIMVEGSRANWTPRPIVVKEWQIQLFAEEPFRESEPILANAFTMETVSYRWSKGRRVRPDPAS